MNATRVAITLARIKQAMAKGKQHTGAYQWKLLKKAHAKYTKLFNEFSNPKAPARPLPPRIQDSMKQPQLFNR